MWMRTQYPPADLPVWRGERYEHGKIRIGYVSADFRQHPVADLLAGVFEGHDRSQFEILGIAIGTNDNSEIRRRLERSFDRFIDAAGFDDDELAKRIREEEIDILIDLSGFTQNARTGIFARRPAPIQVTISAMPGRWGLTISTISLPIRSLSRRRIGTVMPRRSFVFRTASCRTTTKAAGFPKGSWNEPNSGCRQMASNHCRWCRVCSSSPLPWNSGRSRC
jgi:Glycosyl transferase family 41